MIDAAMHVFWRQGYRATSIDDLVGATGLQRGSLYGAFGDKQGMLLRSLDAYAAQFNQRLDDLMNASPDPVDAIRALVHAAGDDCRDDEMSGRGCLIGNTCTELAAHDETARARVDDFVTDVRRSLADALRRAQAMGTFGADREPDAVAMFVQCGLQGLALICKSRQDPQLIGAVVDEILRVLDQPPSDTSRPASDPRTPLQQE